MQKSIWGKAFQLVKWISELLFADFTRVQESGGRRELEALLWSVPTAAEGKTGSALWCMNLPFSLRYRTIYSRERKWAQFTCIDNLQDIHVSFTCIIQLECTVFQKPLYLTLTFELLSFAFQVGTWEPNVCSGRHTLAWGVSWHRGTGTGRAGSSHTSGGREVTPPPQRFYHHRDNSEIRCRHDNSETTTKKRINRVVKKTQPHVEEHSLCSSMILLFKV